MNLEQLLKLNLQLFSETDNGADDTGASKDKLESDEGDKGFTEEQQEQINKIVVQAKSKAKAEALKDQEDIISSRIREALEKEKDYSKMSEREREHKEFEDKLKAFEEQKADFEYKELLVKVREDLVEKGLPSKFAEFVAVKGDSQTSLENVGSLQKIFDKAVSNAVKEQLKQPHTKEGGSHTQGLSLGSKLAQQQGTKRRTVFEN